jgi:uncharacterized membrane protein
MQGIVEFLKGWQLHPVVDHFTVALVLVGILVDLVGSLMPSRVWLRYMAATLMVLAAVAAYGSFETGGWEADRVWDHFSGPAKDLLETHARLGSYLPYVFGLLALWRLGVQFLGFLARTRWVYLLAAIAAGGAIIYQGDLGGDLVYDYGVGTAPMMAPTPAATETPATVQQVTPLPTVSIPTPTPTATAVAPTATATSNSATPDTGTPVNPPPGAAVSATPGAKSTNL